MNEKTYSNTDSVRVVDLQVAIYAAMQMLDGEGEKDAVEAAKSAHYNSTDSEMPAHDLVNLLYSFAKAAKGKA